MVEQSAIQWFNEQVQKQRSRGVISNERYNELFEQAKAMEKEQIVDAFSEGTRMIDVNDEMSAMLNGFIYYGDNYEQDKQG